MPLKSSYKNKVPYGRNKHKRIVVSFDSGRSEVQEGDGIFDFFNESVEKISKGIVNPLLEDTTYMFAKNRFGKRWADAQNKSIKRALKKDPMFAYNKLRDPDFWDDAFTKTHEFLKNDATMKLFKEPIGDLLGLIPVVGDIMEAGWSELTREDGKETDIKAGIDRMASRIKKEEKTFKKYGIPPPPLAIGFASAEEYKKALDTYSAKYKKQLLTMKVDIMKKKVKQTKVTKKGDGLKRSGEGLKRSGEGLKRSGAGLSRAGAGTTRAGDGYGQKGLGEELKEQMMKEYCK